MNAGAPSAYPAAPGQFPPGVPVEKSGLYQAAAIINWVVMGLLIVCTLGIGIIACAWFIPMTIRIQKGAKDRYSHTGLAVCALLFCNLISGILMLVDSGNRQARPSA